MAAYFFDTSAIVKRYIQEVGTVWVQATAAPASSNAIYLARISAVEFASAITRRQRAGSVTAAEAASALAAFRQDFARQYGVVEITPTLLADAERLAESYALRANDAIQLSAILELQAKRMASHVSPLTLVSSDLDLNIFARAEGLLVDDPNLHP